MTLNLFDQVCLHFHLTLKEWKKLTFNKKKNYKQSTAHSGYLKGTCQR